jgi:hypothetical protein
MMVGALGMSMPAPTMQPPVNPELNQFQFNNISEQIPASAINSVEQYMQQTVPTAPPQIQVIKRNLTVAEIMVLFVSAVVCVGLVQTVWNVIPKPSINIEWRR